MSCIRTLYDASYEYYKMFCNNNNKYNSFKTMQTFKCITFQHLSKNVYNSQGSDF